MQKSRAALIRQESYDLEMVTDAIRRGIQLVGGLELFFKKGEKILLKPNVLAGRSPERATTTHPVVFEAVIRILLEFGVKLSYGDSPGFDSPLTGLKKSGLYEVASRYGITAADFDNGKTVNFPEGSYGRQFEIACGVLEADGIVNLPKMKSHQLTRVTGALKNTFGCIQGFNKAAYHVKVPNAVNFSRMLVDLYRLLKPRLCIMDGIVAMEGNGPASGDPVAMNCILVSRDPVTIDSLFCRLIDLDPEFIPTNVIGREAGLGSWVSEEIEILGDSPESMINPHFNIPRKPVKADAVLPIFRPIRSLFIPGPVIISKKCVRCGICVEACPVPEKAVNFKRKDRSKPPVYNYNKCIRCYCCQEVCPHRAIEVRTPFFGKMIR